MGQPVRGRHLPALYAERRELRVHPTALSRLRGRGVLGVRAQQEHALPGRRGRVAHQPPVLRLRREQRPPAREIHRPLLLAARPQPRTFAVAHALRLVATQLQRIPLRMQRGIFQEEEQLHHTLHPRRRTLLPLGRRTGFQRVRELAEPPLLHRLRCERVTVRGGHPRARWHGTRHLLYFQETDHHEVRKGAVSV